jgi:predicted AlkP superfamily phosphohydrolase/phosphomutase
MLRLPREDEASGAGGRGRAPLVVIGLDACDPATVRRMAAAGELPVIARFIAEGSRAGIRNPFGLFVGAVWANFMTGVRPDRHGFHSWDRIDRDSYAYRLNPPDIGHPPFWDALGGAGRRIALIDVPHACYPEPVNGVAIAEWGCHDRHFGFHTQPPERRAAIVERFGLHPVFGIDPYKVRDFAPDDHARRAGRLRTAAEHKALFDDLIAGVEAKTRLVAAVLAEEDWDFVLAVLGEGHAAGHQAWGQHDPAHPDHDPGIVAAIGGDPVALVYRALDRAVGALLDRIDPEATICLMFSHGMGRHHDGTHMLGEILKRLDDSYRQGGSGVTAHGLLRSGLQALQPAAERVCGAIGLPPRLRRALARKLGARAYGSVTERSRQAFFVEPNNHVYGGIRFNLAGREPNGWVSAEEADALAARLEQDLRAIENEATGRRAIRAVRRCDAFHRRRDGDSMPDLFIDWGRTDRIETVRSPRIGRVHAPYDGWRQGDHRPAGLLLARGPDLPANRVFPRIAMEDLPVGLAARLGVPLTEVDGEAVGWLAGRQAQELQAAAAGSGAGAARHS